MPTEQSTKPLTAALIAEHQRLITESNTLRGQMRRVLSLRRQLARAEAELAQQVRVMEDA